MGHCQNHFHPKLRKMQSASMVLYVFFLITILSDKLTLLQARKGDEDKLKKFLDDHDHSRETISYSNLNKWYTAKQATKNVSIKPEMFPRLFPFCVTHEQVMNPTLNKPTSKLFRFQHIFKLIGETHNVQQKFNHFDKALHSIVGNQDFIKTVRLSRINTPEPDMINLRQWVHITVVSTSGLKGLYMQSLAGPLGLPFGEFNIDFPCSDLRNSEEIDTIGELHYCHYRPRTNIYHPNVYIGYVEGNRDVLVREFHVHFQWTDISCMDAPYIQFLMIAVKNFNVNPVEEDDYQIIFSNVFLNTAFDSFDGSPYPYYPAWKNEMLCNADKTTRLKNQIAKDKEKKNGDHRFADIKWKVADDVFRIQPNEEYDACVRGSNNTDKDNIRQECPPGPFKCTESYDEKAETENVTKSRQQLVDKEKSINDCYPCTTPSCDKLGYTEAQCTGFKTTTKPPVRKVTKVILITRNDTNVIDKTHSVARAKSHGMLSSLAAMIFLPMANYMGRHYKDVCRNCLCGNGPWIFIHIFFHLLSASVLWISVGPVIASIADYDEVLEECKQSHPSDKSKASACATEKSLANPHVPLGLVAMILQNLLLIFGFFRSSHNKFRMVQLFAHSHLGYVTYLIAGTSTLVATYNNNCIEIVALMGALFLIPVVFFFIGCILDIFTDKKVGISPGRKQWPILEPVRLERRGPLEPCKWAVYILFSVLLLGVWFIIVANSNFASKVEDDFDPDTGVSIHEHYAGEKGNMFGAFGGVCGSVNED